MASAPILDDLNHVWGEDIALSPIGDLGRASGTARSQQRILRRLMTAAREYLWEPTYGAGLPRRIGDNLDLEKIKAVVRGQMLQEVSVQRLPPPVVQVREISGGVAIAVQYTALPDRQPVSLSFDVTE